MTRRSYDNGSSVRSFLHLPEGITIDRLLQGGGQGIEGGLGLQLVVEGEWPAGLAVLPGVVLLQPGVAIGEPECDHGGDGRFSQGRIEVAPVGIGNRGVSLGAPSRQT